MVCWQLRLCPLHIEQQTYRQEDYLQPFLLIMLIDGPDRVELNVIKLLRFYGPLDMYDLAMASTFGMFTP